jgi:hypothetical protein
MTLSFLQACAVALVLFAQQGCVTQPRMKLRSAEVTGVRISLPPAIGVLMTLIMEVENPNSYDVAVRAVRGQVVLGDRHVIPVDFRATGDGLWLPSDQTTAVEVPVDIPLPMALEVLRTSSTVEAIPYRFTGRADVTATRTFQLEEDDYSVDAWGVVSRKQIQDAVPF